MSKFLKICEELHPSNADSKDAAFQAQLFLHEQGVKDWKSDGNTILFRTEKGDVMLEAKGFKPKGKIPEEDESVDAGYGEFSATGRVKELANMHKNRNILGKALGTVARSNTAKAAAAEKEQEALDPEVIKTVRAGTKRLKQNLKTAQRSVANANNIKY